VKKNNLTRGAFVALLLSSTIAIAESDYPATDFKPVIVFQDQDANSNSKKNETVAAKQSVQSSKSERSSVGVSNDEDQVSSVSAKSAAKDEKSNSNILIGLGVIAAAGVFFFTRKKSSVSTGSRGAVEGGLTGVERYLQNRNVVAGTGVARYLDKKTAQLKEKAESTGVSRYLRENAKAQRVAASTTSPRGTVGGATGVAKYLRDKG